MRTLTKPPSGLVVVKVGGSLFDHHALGPGLIQYLDPILRMGPAWLVPGGGEVAEAVRKWDRVHRLGDEPAHWIALRAMSVTALTLAALIPGVEIDGEHLENQVRGLAIIDGFRFSLADDGRPGSLPHTWDVTSDSVAARAAVIGHASRLILLKSRDIPSDTPWEEAATRGWVDVYFPTAVANATFPVEVVNFRKWLDEHFPPTTPG